MKPEIKKMWVEALRSGEYRQGRFFLNGRQGFCCYGVLCDLHAKTNGGKWEEDPDFITPRLYLGSDALPPEAVFEWAGLDDMSNTEIISDGEEWRLTYFNDGGASFAEIADAIEAQL